MRIESRPTQSASRGGLLRSGTGEAGRSGWRSGTAAGLSADPEGIGANQVLQFNVLCISFTYPGFSRRFILDVKSSIRRPRIRR